MRFAYFSGDPLSIRLSVCCVGDNVSNITLRGQRSHFLICTSGIPFLTHYFFLSFHKYPIKTQLHHQYLILTSLWFPSQFQIWHPTYNIWIYLLNGLRQINGFYPYSTDRVWDPLWQDQNICPLAVCLSSTGKEFPLPITYVRHPLQ